ncbi:RagB/SusD family nutrient uptake outer membrane protein [Runella aurantiaca]|uniref:RagB/SusD family nutrient uptake outer membrane protein n=1 Tax=Runella aurantiaca TaxID=2282308 RepID=A0A369IAY1_9BACT|nr:RagB/SusD family nutrient uptake outer membrane protein [Runella aurantiaca]RDB06798.1 RagB/SusD family nutrient uptake outer membrane protein [Runella aurantiaca]
MKKITVSIASILFLLIGYACKESFLEVAPTGSLSKAQLTSKAGLEGSLISAYAQLSALGQTHSGPSNWLIGSIRGGDANKGTDPGDGTEMIPIQRFSYNSTDAVAGNVYQSYFEGVSRANAVLGLLKEALPSVKAEDIKVMSAEARFLRGHFYFQLKRNFNMVPYVDETKTLANGLDKVKNDVELWPKIEDDFKAAYADLPETSSAVGRANKWAAASYLAKVYLYQKKYAEAKALFDLIIANGKTTGGKKYALLPKYSDLYRVANDNNAESVFAVQATVKSGNGNNANADLQLNFIQGVDPGTCCGFFQPSFEFVNSFRTDAKGLPLLDGSYNAPANAVKTDMGIKSDVNFTPDSGPLDPRLDHSVGRRGIPFLDWGPHTGFSMIRNQPNGGPYSPKKYIFTKAEKAAGLTETGGWGHQTYNAYNVTIIRFADVLLMAAEAEIEVGSLAKALEYTNMVRGRAANAADYVMIDGKPAANYKIAVYDSFPTKEFARSAVRFERRMELGMEGYRFYDLVRWGEDVAAINKYLQYDQVLLPGALGGAKYEAKYALFPIPQSQIDLLNSTEVILKQNPGY